MPSESLTADETGRKLSVVHRSMSARDVASSTLRRDSAQNTPVSSADTTRTVWPKVPSCRRSTATVMSEKVLDARLYVTTHVSTVLVSEPMKRPSVSMLSCRVTVARSASTCSDERALQASTAQHWRRRAQGQVPICTHAA